MLREGLVSTACACASILPNLQNPNTYGYCGRTCTFTDNFTAKYTENLAHAHAVDTRPSSLRIIEGLGTRLGVGTYIHVQNNNYGKVLVMVVEGVAIPDIYIPLAYE